MGEARRRKEQYRGGNRRAYRLTSSEMEELWRAEAPVDEGIVEDHPLKEKLGEVLGLDLQRLARRPVDRRRTAMKRSS